VIISRAVTDNLTKASWIRRMFEEGARLKQERGADKVFDFSLGNPSPWSATPWCGRSPASSAPFAKRAGSDDVRGHGDRHR
jgi:hypothetical protein